ncbi:MAG: FHA domain-containing protein [Planctomycetota bacterium]|jgi:hypothetical protein|nr:FHA domain-containing protein [Planctomycetota bacterium]
MAVWLRNRFGWWKLPAGELMLGRHKDCTLRLDDPRLSRQHCKLQVRQDGLSVEDLGSSNGVLVNGYRVTTTAECRHGDLLIVGPFTFEVDIKSEEACPAVVEGSLLQGDPSVDPEFMPSTDRHLRQTEDMEWASNQKGPDDPLTPNPHLVGGGDTSEDATTPAPHAVVPPNNPFIESNEDTKVPTDVPSDKIRTTETNLQPQSRRNTTNALTPNDPDSRLRLELRSATGRRFIAAILDFGTCLLLALAFGIPGILGGYCIALHQAGARVAEGVPVLVEVGEPASLLDLAATLTGPNGRDAIGPLLDALRSEHRQAFLVFFIGATAAVLAWVLIVIIWLVAATMIKGAPYWHRRFNLVIRERDSGYFPSAVRCLWRWTLVAALGWLAPIAILLAHRSPHDVLSGCTLRRRDVEPTAVQ